MNYQTIDEIYVANDEIRENLKKLVSNLSDEQANFLLEGEKWTIAKFVEHIAIVENGMMRISAKLLNEAKAKGATSDGRATITEEFSQKISGLRGKKFEAPERVAPSGNQTIAESLTKMEENRKSLEELRPLFKSVGCAEINFPHPILGDINANEWLTMIGVHEARHTQQVVRLLEKIK